MLSAATHAHATGRLAWASDLVSAGLPLATATAVRADFQQLAAAFERDRGSVLRARTILRNSAAAIADEDPTRATLMLISTTSVDLMSGDAAAAAASAQQALAHARSCARAIQQIAGAVADLIASGRGLLPADQIEIEALRGTAASLAQLPATATVTIEMDWAMWHALFRESRRAHKDNELDGVIAEARELGAIGMLPALLSMGAQLDIHEGRWTRASAVASEAIELAHAAGQPSYRAWGLLSVAQVDAAQGRQKDCHAHANEALELADASNNAAVGVFVSSALGLLELGAGNIPGAVEQLQECAERAEASGVVHPNIVRYEPDLVEALYAAGNHAQAGDAADLLAQRAERVRSPWGLATAARCRGLLATQEDESEKEFLAALALHEHVPSPFERARTQLCYGERLHRARRRTDAREQLRQALHTFEHLGADPWAERARRELRATGIKTPRPSNHPATDTLTPQELRVALIIADGATIQEAATQLFLSPKTIQAHLGRAYRKLNVRNRAELATTVARQEVVAA